MNRRKTIIISLTIVLFTGLNLFNFTWLKPSLQLAHNGVVDLSTWNFNQEKLITLDGEWEFYPGELIVPRQDEDSFLPYKNIKTLIEVPGSWENDSNLKVNDMNVGTYRLLIKLPFDAEYGIKTNKINYSNELFLNGILVGSSGVPAAYFSDYVGDIGMYAGIASSINQQMEVVFHVANHQYPTGGLVNSVHFGPSNEIIKLRDIERAKDTLLISGYLLISVFFLFLYAKERKNRYYLFFGLATLFVCFHLSLLNERILDLFIPEISVSLRTNLQISLVLYALLAFLWFTYDFYKSLTNRKTLRFITGLIGFHALFYTIPPLKDIVLRDVSLVGKQILIVTSIAIVMAYVMYILIKAFILKKTETEYIFVILLTFLCYGSVHVVDLLFNVPVGQVPIILFSIMILFLSFLMGKRAEIVNKQIVQLSNNLLAQDRIKDDFLAITSSKLVEPLTRMKDKSKKLMEDNEYTLKMEQREDVMTIYQTIQQLEYITSDLLSAVQVKKGNINIDTKQVHLEILNRVIQEINLFVVNEKNIKLINYIPESIPFVYVDEDRLQQIVFNLLHNAVKYTYEGTIELSAKVMKEKMLISVTDTGIGIPIEERQMIFTTFYRGEHQLNQLYTGLGLGLTITKQLVELSGGEIWVESPSDIGTTITFSLPLASQIQKTKEITANNLPLIQGKSEVSDQGLEYPYIINGDHRKTILIVSSDELEMKALIKIIHSAEYNLIAIDAGMEALQMIEKENIDLLIVDSTLTDLTSEAFCQQVRKKYNMIDLPILKLITWSELILQDTLGKSVTEMFLKKPINENEITKTVESLFGMKDSAKKSVHDELSFFHAQIIPHFLYNTINTIISLSYIDEKKTREALEHLAVYFRAKLNFYKRDEMIPLAKELELVKSYTAIEKIRFGDRIEMKMEIDQTVELEIPPLTLQPLVENALGHGLLKKIKGGRLTLSVQRKKHGIEIIIADNGLGMTAAKREELLTGKDGGIGFSNAYNRLRLIKNLTFTLETELNKGTKITIFMANE